MTGAVISNLNRHERRQVQGVKDLLGDLSSEGECVYGRK